MSDVKVITGWAGWCTPCGDEQRPLILTKAGRFGVRSWVTGVGYDERVLLLTCRVCGGWQHVPWHEEDDLLGLEAAATVAAELLAELEGPADPAPAEPLTQPLTQPLPRTLTQPLTADLLPVPAADAVVGWQPAEPVLTPQERAARLAATVADPYAVARQALPAAGVHAHQADPTVPAHRTDPLSPELTADLAAALQSVGGTSTALAHGPATSAPIAVKMPAPAPRSAAGPASWLPVQTTTPTRRTAAVPAQPTPADVDPVAVDTAAVDTLVEAAALPASDAAGPAPATAGTASPSEAVATATRAVMRVFRLPADGVRRDDAACTVLPLPRPRAAAEVSPDELRDLLDVG